MMSVIEQLQDLRARNAISQAGEAARVSYAEISRAHNELNALEAEGVYQPEHLEDRRREVATRVTGSVGRRLDEARDLVGSEASRVATELDQAGRVDAQEIAAATSRISLVYGDGLRDDPNQLLAYYRNIFDHPGDRRAVEELAERLLFALPEGPAKEAFRIRLDGLQDELAERLPAKERELRATLRELERTKEYVSSVEQATTATIRGLVDPRARGNLTAYTEARVFEEEVFGEARIER